MGIDTSFDAWDPSAPVSSTSSDCRESDLI
jgi:hypothetical protein